MVERTAATDRDKERLGRNDTFLVDEDPKAEDSIDDSPAVDAESSTLQADRRPPPTSSGVICLCVVAGHHQRAADALQLSRALGLDPSVEMTSSQLLLAARELGLKAKVVRSSWDRLTKATLPAIVEYTDGSYRVLLRSDPDGKVVVGDPKQLRPERQDRDQFEAGWSGNLVLVTTRLRVDNPNRPFGLLWFVPGVWKYRAIIGEILAASFVIQLFGLATPLFTQVIIDKVLM